MSQTKIHPEYLDPELIRTALQGAYSKIHADYKKAEDEEDAIEIIQDTIDRLYKGEWRKPTYYAPKNRILKAYARIHKVPLEVVREKWLAAEPTKRQRIERKLSEMLYWEDKAGCLTDFNEDETEAAPTPANYQPELNITPHFLGQYLKFSFRTGAEISFSLEHITTEIFNKLIEHGKKTPSSDHEEKLAQSSIDALVITLVKSCLPNCLEQNIKLAIKQLDDNEKILFQTHQTSLKQAITLIAQSKASNTSLSARDIYFMITDACAEISMG